MIEIIELLKKGDIDIECVCCPIRDVCTIPCGANIIITKDMLTRSGCGGSFTNAFEFEELPA